MKSLLLVIWLLLASSLGAAHASIREPSRRSLDDGSGGADPTPAPTEDDSWPVGTKVYWQFDDGWYEGTITDYDADGYTITWSDDSIDYDDFTDDDVDQMVANYQNMVASDDSWPVGTKVYWKFDDGWYEGTITDYDADGYTITWSDDSIDYDDFSDDVVDQMVANYQSMVANGGGAFESSSASASGMKPIGVFFIVAGVLILAFVGFFGWRHSRKSRMLDELTELHLERDGTKEFS